VSHETGGALSAGWLTTISDAVKILSRHRLNAALILADSNSSAVGGGVVIEGKLSEALLVTLFVPDSLNKLAAGAVVIRDRVVERAAVPIVRGPGWEWVGDLAEEVRAIIISVAEEDGLVRVVTRGSGVHTVEPAALARHLADTLSAKGGAHAE